MLIEPGADKLAKGPFEASRLGDRRARDLINAFNFLLGSLGEGRRRWSRYVPIKTRCRPRARHGWRKAMVRAVVEARGCCRPACAVAGVRLGRRLLDAVEPFDWHRLH